MKAECSFAASYELTVLLLERNDVCICRNIMNSSCMKNVRIPVISLLLCPTSIMSFSLWFPSPRPLHPLCHLSITVLLDLLSLLLILSRRSSLSFWHRGQIEENICKILLLFLFYPSFAFCCAAHTIACYIPPLYGTWNPVREERVIRFGNYNDAKR